MIRNELAAAETKIETLDASIDDISNRMRRNSLIFYGLPEKGNKTWDDTADNVTTFVETRLGIVIGDIERAHRMGVRRPNSTRPVVVRILNFKNKENVLKNAHRLKNLASP